LESNLPTQELPQSSANNAELITSLLRRPKLTSWLMSVFVAMLSSVIVVNTFYYKTTITLDDHGASIKEIKQDLNAVQGNMQDVMIYQSSNTVEIKFLKERVQEMETKIDKMNDKLDKILIQTRQ